MLKLTVAALAAVLFITTATAKDRHLAKASWYDEGERVATGARFNPEAMTCAHKSYPFGTKLLVTAVSSGKSVVCTVNDRGPFIRGRELDLSRGAFRVIASLTSGIVEVSIEILS